MKGKSDDRRGFLQTRVALALFAYFKMALPQNEWLSISLRAGFPVILNWDRVLINAKITTCVRTS
jgi:hypothetical protein